MPSHRSKKRKTTHNNSNQHTEANSHLTHDQIWDDSALVQSWNSALKEYEKYHSLATSGLSQAEIDAVLDDEEERQAREAREKGLVALNQDGGDGDGEEEGEINESEENEQVEVDPDSFLIDAPAAASNARVTTAGEPLQATSSQILNVQLEQLDALGSRNFGSRHTGHSTDANTEKQDEVGARKHRGPIKSKESGMSVNTSAKMDEITKSGALSMQPVVATATTEPLVDTADDPDGNADVDNDGNQREGEAEEALENMKMAFYWAGYYAGRYNALRGKDTNPKPGADFE